MDVALRACNWLVSWELIKNSISVTKEFKTEFSQSLYDHGQYLRRYLEWGVERSSNHYLSNLIGLLYLGLVLGQDEWVGFSTRELETEMFHQVHEDGFDFETSTAYHRLVTEIFFYSAHALKKSAKSKKHFSAAFHARLQKMFSIFSMITSDGGHMPLIGDNDSGRVFSLLARHDVDVRYLSAFGAIFFKSEELKREGWEPTSESVWLFGFPGHQTFKSMKGISWGSVESKTAQSSGLVSLRNPGVLVVSAQSQGLNGLGNHTHNDKLSFTFSIGEEEFFIDAGTLTYTADPEARNLFRSTRLHNTVCVDGHEQNRFDETNLFRLKDDAHVHVEKENAGQELVASHSGYQRLVDPVVHRRRIRRQDKSWLIEDILDGKEEHELEWCFMLGPHIKVKKEKDGRVVLEGEKYRVTLTASASLDLQEEKAFCAPLYGVRSSTSLLRARLKTRLPYRIEFMLDAQLKTDKANG
jgi:hypothetical protein